jgi:hypothetical protein
MVLIGIGTLGRWNQRLAASLNRAQPKSFWQRPDFNANQNALKFPGSPPASHSRTVHLSLQRRPLTHQGCIGRFLLAASL